jgi:hypothetical protein
MAILITGPSSVGKSMFLASPECRRFGVDRRRQVVFGSRIKKSSFPTDALVHYNLLHGALEFSFDLSDLGSGWGFDDDPVFTRIVGSGLIERCIVLVAPLSELMERMRNRTVVEADDPALYDASLWQEIISRLDLDHVYEALFSALDGLAIPYRVVFSSSQRPEKFTASTRAFVPENLRGRYVY